MLFKLSFLQNAFEENKLAVINGNYQIPPTSRYSPQFHSLFSYIFVLDPDHRPTVYDLLEKIASMRGSNPVFSFWLNYQLFLFVLIICICWNETSKKVLLLIFFSFCSLRCFRFIHPTQATAPKENFTTPSPSQPTPSPCQSTQIYLGLG